MYQSQHGGQAIFEKHETSFSPDGRILDLSANINPLGFPIGVEEAIIQEIPFVTRYPDSLSRRLRQEIAAWEQVDPDWIFCGNGASDIIFRLPVCIGSKTALLPVPTFSDYERSLKAYGANIYYHYLSEEQSFLPDDSLLQNLVKHKPGLIFLCNPNNPTGLLTERWRIEEILSWGEKAGVWVVVDECFMDFVEKADEYTTKPLLKRYKNLMILKAFTKIFALPGLRLGYAICPNADRIEGLYKSGPDWAVSNLAQAAGIAALRAAATRSYLAETVSFVSQERQSLRQELIRMGYIPFDSQANYVFFRNPYPLDLYQKLKVRGILLRNCQNYVGLSGAYYRVAVSTRKNNQTFREAMEKLWT